MARILLNSVSNSIRNITTKAATKELGYAHTHQSCICQARASENVHKSIVCGVRLANPSSPQWARVCVRLKQHARPSTHALETRLRTCRYARSYCANFVCTPPHCSATCRHVQESCSPPGAGGRKIRGSTSRALTVIVVHVVAAVHLQRQRAVGAGPALDAHAPVLAVLQRALAVPRAAVLAAG